MDGYKSEYKNLSPDPEETHVSQNKPYLRHCPLFLYWHYLLFRGSSLAAWDKEKVPEAAARAEAIGAEIKRNEAEFRKR